MSFDQCVLLGCKPNNLHNFAVDSQDHCASAPALAVATHLALLPKKLRINSWTGLAFERPVRVRAFPEERCSAMAFATLGFSATISTFMVSSTCSPGRALVNESPKLENLG